MTSRSDMEIPRESPSSSPERGTEAGERPETAAESAESAVAEAAKEFAAEGEALEASGASEFERVTTGSGLSKEEIGSDAGIRDAKRELDEIAARGRRTVGAFTARLAGVGARVKRLGRAIVAGAVISGSAMSTAEAAAPPDRGPKIERTEKGDASPAWDDVMSAAEAAAYADADLAAERGADGRKEFMRALKSWDQERARKDAAELAGLDVGTLSKDGFRKVEVWSDKKFHQEQYKDVIPMPESMDSLAENDEIAFRPSKFLDARGRVDEGKVKKGATHEFLHVITTAEQGGDARQKRLWDQAGISHELNEGVTELFALRIAQKEGVKIENHQAYAGGDLVAARLLEGLVGRKALFADYVEGTTGRISGALDAALGKGAAERILARSVGVGQEGDTLAMALAMSRAGVDVAKLWAEAKAEGFLDDLTVSPDGKAVTVSRDLQGKEVLVNSMIDEGEAVTEQLPVMRVFVSTHREGRPFGAGGVKAAADGVRRATEIAERAGRDLRRQLDGLAEEYRRAERAGDAEKLKQLDPPEALPRIYKEVLPGQIAAAKAEAERRGEDVADGNMFFNSYKEFGGLQKAYADAPTPEAKAAARSAIEAANEAAARAAAKEIRLDNMTPPIPPGAK